MNIWQRRMSALNYETEEQVLLRAKEAEGKSFYEIDKTGRLKTSKNKGGLGQIIEESLFEYEINNNAKPDFENLGIELKVTPIKINKNKTISSKERLVLNIINYVEEYDKTFFTSSFWLKNQKLLMMFYLWEPEIPKDNYIILKSLLYEYPEEDLIIIQRDWEIIVQAIRDGKAHELSEGDTLYLGACTKGANRNSVRVQPFSERPARQRAYSLKQSYMSTIIRQEFNHEKLVKFTSVKELKEQTLEGILDERFSGYIGMELVDIADSVGYRINEANYSTIPNLISTVLGISGTKLNQIEEFAKSNIQFKTIRLEPNGVPKESMSFENINFHEWLNEEWEDNQMFKTFEETKFLFIVFEYKDKYEKGKKRKLYFKGIKLWNMPIPMIENEIKQVWTEVRRVLIEGVQLVPTKRGISNNFPKSKFNGVAHIRPKGKDSSDKVQLPDGQMITKQCYWLNREYIAKILIDIS